MNSKKLYLNEDLLTEADDVVMDTPNDVVVDRPDTTVVNGEKPSSSKTSTPKTAKKAPSKTVKKQTSSEKTAIKQAAKKAEKDKKQLDKKGEKIIARDFSMKSKEYTFYEGHDYEHPYTYGEWVQRWIDPKTKSFKATKDKPFHKLANAIVVDKDGYYIRRGTEDLASKLIKFKPRNNDKLNDMHRVEPYTYGKSSTTSGNAERKAADPEPKTSAKSTPKSEKTITPKDGAEVKKPSKVEKPVNPEKPAPKKSDDKTPKTVTKKVTDSELGRFRTLSSISGLHVYKKADENKAKLSLAAQKDITVANIEEYGVTVRKKDYDLNDWIATAASKGFLKDLSSNAGEIKDMKESFNRSLTEVYEYEIEQGMLVDFGVYGQLYVCDPNYSEHYYWVTDDESDRYNRNASGWSISKDLALSIIDDDDE